MGMENDVMLTFLSDEERFADTFNFGYFAGEPIVQAGKLTDISEVYRPSIRRIYEIATIKKQKEKTKAKAEKSSTRTRDIIKTLCTGQSIKIVAIESQSDINYLMPWRIMNYDDNEYERQVKRITKQNKHNTKTGQQIYRNNSERLSEFRANDKLNPVYTLCVYHGTKPWDGPRSLKDLMDFGTENPELWEQFFADYPMRLLCLNEIQDFSNLHSSAKELFALMPYRKNKQELLNYVNSHPEYHTLDSETADAISCIANIPNLIERKETYKTEGGYDMCQAIKELIEDSKAEGRTEGHAEGRDEGIELTTQVYKYLQSHPNATNDVLVATFECNPEIIQKIRTALDI